ncbi:hypothetical protein C8D84_101341 [Psychrobacter immobilis]|uniref:Molecular chaperone n=1 Tax=Psychrobacter immobilis TaxID=498 RepID=A0A2V2A6T3_PSYIM|nr:hypothetical protein [Psychrobacter immobilis]PWK15390.1 hypothetical protein C8D84_101341 [Psychrobacter immobilis]
MITLSTFQEHLSSTEALPLVSKRSANGQEGYLLKLLAALPSQTQAQQAEQLAKILTVLRVANIDDSQRLTLMATVIDASDQLIATLRQSYIYETGALSDIQMGYVAQIKSLYYSIIMTYDRVIRHKTSLLNNQRKYAASNGWQRYFNGDKSSSTTLASAIYQTLLMYQKLLGEEALCYQKPSSYLWHKINQLYYLAYQYHAAEINMSVMTGTQRAKTVHQLYCQICLYSLLNVRAMRRPNILLVQRLLPEWAKHIVATIEPTTETRVFVDLQSDNPPNYLTASSTINPYDDRYHCLFIEIAPLVEYLKRRKQALVKEGGDGVESHLLNKIAMTLNYRYLQPPLTLATKHSAKEDAVLITGFNNIHYRVSHSHSFTSLIAIKELPDEQRPRYDTVNKKQDSSHVLASETFDRNDDLSLFRTLRLSSTVDTLNKDRFHKDGFYKESVHKDSLNIVADEDTSATTAPPALHMMSLFLVCRSDTIMPPDWSMGVARWLDFDSKNPEIEWQVLGHQLVACGLRLEGKETRSRHFVPAFILGRDERLQTTGTLIVPTSYFQTHDRVIMRINSKQTPLRLGQRLLITDEFSQYEVVQL